MKTALFPSWDWIVWLLYSHGYCTADKLNCSCTAQSPLEREPWTLQTHSEEPQITGEERNWRSHCRQYETLEQYFRKNLKLIMKGIVFSYKPKPTCINSAFLKNTVCDWLVSISWAKLFELKCFGHHSIFNQGREHGNYLHKQIPKHSSSANGLRCNW